MDFKNSKIVCESEIEELDQHITRTFYVYYKKTLFSPAKVNRLIDWDASEPGELTKKVLKFAETPYKYSIRKLGPAERNNLYVGPGENATVTDGKIHFMGNYWD